MKATCIVVDVEDREGRTRARGQMIDGVAVDRRERAVCCGGGAGRPGMRQWAASRPTPPP